MSFWDYIVSPLTGAIVGLFTNWIAIKMLFRPRKAIYIGKFKVPFTPGVIPKEKERLAKVIGKTVKDNLLTKENLQDEINRNDIPKVVSEKIDELVLDLKTNDYTVFDLINKVPFENKNEIILKGEQNLNLKIEEFLNSETLRESLNNIMAENLISYLKTHNISNISGEFYAKSETFFFDLQKNYLTEENINNFISSEIDKSFLKLKSKDYKFKEVVTDNQFEITLDFINDIIDKIPDTFEDLLEKNPDLDRQIFELVSKVIEDNTNTLTRLIINDKRIYENTKRSIIDFFRNEAKVLQTKVKVRGFLTDAKEKDLNIFLDKVNLEDLTGLKSIAIDIINTNNTEKNVSKILNIIKTNLKNHESLSYYEILSKFIDDFDNTLNNLIKEISEKIIKEAKIKTKREFPKLKNYIFKFKVNTIFEFADDEKILKLKAETIKFAESAVKKAFDYAMEKIDIVAVVERQINKFDEEEMENIILDIVHKELKIITVLGGVLGLFIGSIQLFL